MPSLDAEEHVNSVQSGQGCILVIGVIRTSKNCEIVSILFVNPLLV